MALKKHQKTLVWASAAALALWLVAPLRFLLLPLVFYNTHVHELCHAIAAMLTGGGVGTILVMPDGSGLTTTVGGSEFFISSAGYVGSSIVGGILVFGSRTAQSARKMLWVAAGFLALSMLLFVRGEAAGVLIGLAWIVALGMGALLLNGDAAVFAAQFLGVQTCLTSLQSFLVLIRVAAGDLGHSDASNMEAATHVPAIVWSLLWLAFSLAVIGLGIRASWSNRPD